MDQPSGEELERLDSAAEASDLLTAPEGVKRYVDLIGDENLDGWRTGEASIGNND